MVLVFVFLESLILELERKMLWKPKDLTNVFSITSLALTALSQFLFGWVQVLEQSRELAKLPPCTGRGVPLKEWHRLHTACHRTHYCFPSVPVVPTVGGREKIPLELISVVSQLGDLEF